VERESHSSSELFVDIHTAVDDAHDRYPVRFHDVKDRVHSNAEAAQSRSEARSLAADERKSGNILEFSVDVCGEIIGCAGVLLRQICIDPQQILCRPVGNEDPYSGANFTRPAGHGRAAKIP
jgi:hypothetical protein